MCSLAANSSFLAVGSGGNISAVYDGKTCKEPAIGPKSLPGLAIDPNPSDKAGR
jgi:hypothetical protein